MLKRAAIAVIVLASATGALADTQTECDREDGPPDQAIVACSQVIKADPRAAWAYFKRGNAYQVKGELDRAIADYDKAIALDPMLAVAYNNRGNVHTRGQCNRRDQGHNPMSVRWPAPSSGMLPLSMRSIRCGRTLLWLTDGRKPGRRRPSRKTPTSQPGTCPVILKGAASAKPRNSADE
jgi:tetratricopeptide (TPR) repeat protein